MPSTFGTPRASPRVWSFECSVARRPSARRPRATAPRACTREARRSSKWPAGSESARSVPFTPRWPKHSKSIKPVAVVEFDLERLARWARSPRGSRRWPVSPPAREILPVVVSADVLAGEVEQAARHAAAEMAERVVLFDRFVGGSVPPGTREPRTSRRLPRSRSDVDRCRGRCPRTPRSSRPLPPGSALP